MWALKDEFQVMLLKVQLTTYLHPLCYTGDRVTDIPWIDIVMDKININHTYDRLVLTVNQGLGGLSFVY